jgi:DnaJ-class molecular chaperone
MICPHCKGTGEEPHSHNKDYNGLSCVECNGMGELKENIDFHEKGVTSNSFKRKRWMKDETNNIRN